MDDPEIVEGLGGRRKAEAFIKGHESELGTENDRPSRVVPAREKQRFLREHPADPKPSEMGSDRAPADPDYRRRTRDRHQAEIAVELCVHSPQQMPRAL